MKASKLIGLLILLLFMALPGMSQNTKGDKPQGGAQTGKRESRFKLPFKKKKKGQPNYNRAQSKGVSRASSARRGAKPGKTKVYPQPGNTVRNPSDKQRAWRGNAAGNRVSVRSRSGRTGNIYPQYGRYVNNPSKKPKNTQRAVSNRSTLTRLNKLQGPEPSPPKRKQKVVPRSASRSFIRNKSINIYANFPRPKKRPERAVTRDIAGRKLRTKNYETPRPEVITSTTPYRRPKRVGDRPYVGPGGPKHKRTPSVRQKAWTGDIAGRKLRHLGKSSRPDAQPGQPVFPPRRIHDRYGDRPYRGPSGGYRSASKPGEKRTGLSPNPARAPGIGGVGGFNAKIKGQRPLKGGGSVSGRSWNNQRRPIAVRPPGANGMRVGGFPGKLKRFGADPGYNDQGEGFAGYQKRGKPLKGGGSVSGRVWNNQRRPIAVRQPGSNGMKVGGFPGKLKRFEADPGFNDQGEGFSGYQKRGKPLKGGGSVSGKLWNNKENPINVRTPRGARAGDVNGFPGKLKRYQADPGFSDQGEEFTGYIRRPRLWKDYIRNDKAAKESLKKKRPTSATYRTGDLQVNVKQRRYIRNKALPDKALPKQAPTPSTYEADGLQVKIRQSKYVKNKNAADESLLKKAPTKGTYQTGELQVRVKQRPYGKKEHGAEGSLPGIKPTKESVKASEFSRSIRRRWDYVKNSSSADEALRVREPGRAFTRSTDYQGNIKMKKFELFEKNRRLHPDSKFVKINKNNVDSERDTMTNFKLWWSRLFKKQDAQPEHLKEKVRKPRYDKGEDGLWYD